MCLILSMSRSPLLAGAPATYSYAGAHVQGISVNFGPQHDCAALLKAHHDSIARDVRARVKEQLKASRQVGAVTAALQASRQRHSEQHGELKALEARLVAAESNLASALAAQRSAASRQAEVRTGYIRMYTEDVTCFYLHICGGLRLHPIFGVGTHQMALAGAMPAATLHVRRLSQTRWRSTTKSFRSGAE